MKWNYEKLPQRDSVFCEVSQKPAGGVEVVEFHICYVIIIVWRFRYHCLRFQNGRQINIFNVIIIFIYDISQEEVKEACDLEVIEEA